MIELTFLEKLILIKQVHQNSAIFVMIGIIVLSFNQMTAIDVIAY